MRRRDRRRRDGDVRRPGDGDGRPADAVLRARTTRTPAGCWPRCRSAGRHGERLTPIPGLPPSLIGLPPGCPFQPRCREAFARCLREDPPLLGRSRRRTTARPAGWPPATRGRWREARPRDDVLLSRRAAWSSTSTVLEPRLFAGRRGRRAGASTASTSRCAAARRSASSARPAAASRRSRAASTRLHDLTAGRVVVRRARHLDGSRAAAAARTAGACRWSSRTPTARSIRAAASARSSATRSRIHGVCEGAGAAPAGAGADGARRAQPRALQPLPGGVLRRPAPAHRHRARARAAARARRLRRAGVGARRLDPGADPQPARPICRRSSG